MARGESRVLRSTSTHTRTTFCRGCSTTFQGRPETVNALLRLHVRKCSGTAEPVSIAAALDIISPQLSRRRHPEDIFSTPVVTAIDNSSEVETRTILPLTGGLIHRGSRRGCT